MLEVCCHDLLDFFTDSSEHPPKCLPRKRMKHYIIDRHFRGSDYVTVSQLLLSLLNARSRSYEQPHQQYLPLDRNISAMYIIFNYKYLIYHLHHLYLQILYIIYIMFNQKSLIYHLHHIYLNPRCIISIIINRFWN